MLHFATMLNKRSIVDLSGTRSVNTPPYGGKGFGA